MLERFSCKRSGVSDIFSHRLAIYYLNAVSEAYMHANNELKKKMQMVSCVGHTHTLTL